MNTLYFLVNRGVINIPLPHFPRTQYSNIPIVPARHRSRSGPARQTAGGEAGGSEAN